MSNFTITVATAGARLQTNSNVINRWIAEGRIPSVVTDDGVRIPLESFERICSELVQWIADNTEEGRISVKDLEEFWKSHATSTPGTNQPA